LIVSQSKIKILQATLSPHQLSDLKKEYAAVTTFGWNIDACNHRLQEKE
jgi:hypothetical protein